MTNWLRKVRNFASKIPQGKVTTYGEIVSSHLTGVLSFSKTTSSISRLKLFLAWVRLIKFSIVFIMSRLSSFNIIGIYFIQSRGQVLVVFSIESQIPSPHLPIGLFGSKVGFCS